ncbi:MAG: transcription elongation factor GreA [Candidatus Promineifilaceae bacterium]|jgi:transcription elongation factor GreA
MNQNNDVVYVTADGLQNLKDELTYLTTTKREELSVKLETAIAQGDLKENADYHDAKEEQGFVEARVRDIEDILRRAQIIDDNGPSDIVRVGSTVTVSEEGYDEEETYSIVGAAEANPAEGRISNESPIGQALLGARKGQVVRANTPGGNIEFTILSIG